MLNVVSVLYCIFTCIQGQGEAVANANQALASRMQPNAVEFPMRRRRSVLMSGIKIYVHIVFHVFHIVVPFVFQLRAVIESHVFACRRQ